MDEQAAVRARREGPDYRTDRLVGGALGAHRLLHWAKARGRRQQLIAALPGIGMASVRGRPLTTSRNAARGRHITHQLMHAFAGPRCQTHLHVRPPQ